jgi:hypothetical protein
MIRSSLRLLFLFAAFAACGLGLHAQAGKKITIRMLDAKTGHLIPSDDFLVRVDHEADVHAHADWVKQNEDGSGDLVIPADAVILSIQGKFDSSMAIYINCDTVLDKPNPLMHWYKVADILSSGVVAPNGCSKLKDIAKPGEFVFFVRKPGWRDQVQDYER